MGEIISELNWGVVFLVLLSCSLSFAFEGMGLLEGHSSLSLSVGGSVELISCDALSLDQIRYGYKRVRTRGTAGSGMKTHFLDPRVNEAGIVPSWANRSGSDTIRTRPEPDQLTDLPI